MKKALPFLVYMIVRALHATLRVRHVRPEHIENTPQYILTFWHQHLLLMFYTRFRAPITIMASMSKDGDYTAAIVGYYGAKAVRGSSSRGGAMALRELIRRARSGENIAFTPDGPRGPARVVQAGVITAAQMSGLPILPVAFAAKKKSCCDPGIA